MFGLRPYSLLTLGLTGAPMEDHVLTLEDLAKYLNVHPSTVVKLVNAGKIPAFRVGLDWQC